MNRASSPGFTLLETVVAVAVSVVFGYFLLLGVQSFLHWSALLAARNGDEATVGGLVDRWQAEEYSAWAIFTPPQDVLGRSNADRHELDFFTRDGKNRPYFWAYSYDSSARTLQRYRYSSPGAAPVADGPPETGIASFVAQTFPLTALQDPSSPVYSSLYQNATLQASAVRFGYANAPWIAGGNQITYVKIATATRMRELQLTTQTAPSGFTIVLRYTPTPAPTTGPLHTLGKIVFEPASLAYNDPVLRIARGINALFGGGIAGAQSATCTYAQLYLDTGALDSNGKDGFNSTDANGCITNAQVRLWATEANYPASEPFTYVLSNSNSCLNYASVSPTFWYSDQYSIVTAVKGTTGCTIVVASADKNATNGLAAKVSAVVNATPCVSGISCYAEWTLNNEDYDYKCNGGGAFGPPCPFGGGWVWRSSSDVKQYVSTDGGFSWSDLGANYDCHSSVGNYNPPPCTPKLSVSPYGYTLVETTTYNGKTKQLTDSGKWSPSDPPGKTGL